jgi:DNA modification methylase
MSRDEWSNKILIGDALETLKKLPDGCIHTCVTSPPYWGLRDYGTEGQIGLEKTPEEYVKKLVNVFQEVRRVLRPDGTLWLNLGDCYAGSWGNQGRKKERGTQRDINGPMMQNFEPYPDKKTKTGSWVNDHPTLKAKDLIGIPWMVAFALRSDGWWLRSDIIWCLSGGTWIYVKTASGAEGPMMLRDMARLKPDNVQVWTGRKWSNVLGFSKSKRTGKEIEFVLRSGETIACTSSHRFPTSNGLKEARDLKVGDKLKRVRLPEPQTLYASAYGLDVAWFIGLYLAEGSRSGALIQLALHIEEEEAWLKLKALVKRYGSGINRTRVGNCMQIRISGKVLNAIIDTFISGHGGKTKCLAPPCWKMSNQFIEHLLRGYLDCDAHYEPHNRRHRLGFTRNYNLARDLRTLAARLGWKIKLKPNFAQYQGGVTPGFRGELRKEISKHWNTKDSSEIVAINKSRAREFYDVGISDNRHVFALASGILTHNSKKNSMPESVRDRPTKAHEYVFLLAKSESYFYDSDAIREPFDMKPQRRLVQRNSERDKAMRADKKYQYELRDEPIVDGNSAGRNKRTVWSIATNPFPEAHFATFPEELVLPCILAGTSEKGACAICGAFYERIVERARAPRDGSETAPSERDGGLTAEDGIERTGMSHFKYNEWLKENPPRTVGWKKTCECAGEEISPCIVLDPFMGAGTTALVALREKRRFVGMELNPDYAAISERRIAQERAQMKLF